MKKVFPLLLSAGFFFGLALSSVPRVANAAIPSALGWYQIPDTKLRIVCPPAQFGYDFPFFCNGVTGAWNGGIADTRRNRLIVWGGGHGDYAGNEVYALDLNDLTMKRLSDPSPPDLSGGTSDRTSDGKANSRHTYNGLVYIEQLDKMFVFGGALWKGGQTWSDTWLLDLTTLQWEFVSGAGAGPTDHYNSQAHHDPVTKKVLLADRSSLWWFDPTTKQYSRIGPFAIDLATTSVLDPKRRILFAFGMSWLGSPQFAAVNVDTGQAVNMTLSGCSGLMSAAAPGNNEGSGPGLAYDPVQDRIIGWVTGDTVFTFNPDTSSCTSRTFTGGPGVPERQGTFGRFRYFPALNIFVLVNNVDQNAYALRLTSAGIIPPPPSGDTTAPSASIASPANGSTVSGTVTISASASDNVGVVGVQFKLDGQNLGLEDTSTPYSVSWNTTTATNGPHSLTATARDVAGNVGASTVVSVNVNNAVSPPPPPPLPPAAGCSSLTDTAAHAPPAIPARPALRQEYQDPTFGACVTRVTDVAQHGDAAVHDYSELQAWNADQSKILLQNGKIIDAGTSALIHSVDFGFPEGGSGLRWSPTDPNVLYYLGQKVGAQATWLTGCSATAARLMRYRLPAGTKELVACFPEYVRFDKNRSFQSLSVDGRFIALVGSPRDGAACEGTTACEVFLYDLVNKAKVMLLSIPAGTYIEWVEPSPLGDYLLINYGQGGECARCGVVSYDLAGNRVGQLATGHGHGSTALAPDGSQWYVFDAFSTSFAPGGNQPQIVKARIPNGYDAWKTGDLNSMVSLLLENWDVGQHISCKTPRSEWCAVSTYAMPNATMNFYHEVFRLSLNSTLQAPKVQRLVHHYSDYNFASSCANLGAGYWAQPHASTNRDGSKILFGSNWGPVCRAEAYVVRVGGAVAPPPSGDTTAPSASIVSPANGSTVSGTVTVSASASDNVGVVGVQFKLDGQNLGAEDLTSPYSTSWNTTQAANGSHILSILARDAAGNSSSAALSVTVSNGTPPPPPAPTSSAKFVFGDRVQTTANLNVRAAPSLVGAILGVQPFGARGTITGGSIVADGFAWWQINYDTGADGWSAENFLTKATQAATAVNTLVIANAAVSVTGASATITWTTNFASLSQAKYGMSVAYGQSTAPTRLPGTAHTHTLQNLRPNTMYHVRAVALIPGSFQSVLSGDLTFTTGVVPAGGALSTSTPPTIFSALQMTNISVSSITANSATVTWTTSQAAISQVKYGTTTAYGQSTAFSRTPATAHVQTLTRLLPGKTYQVRMAAYDPISRRIFYSANFTFTTAP